ncbi:glycosyltransferase [Providencia manganoxydans]|uniref:glycosyltransferase n=1 Tax=Providencia TaxID=586 RepID=UPI0034E45120
MKKNRILILQNSLKTVYIFRKHYIDKLIDLGKSIEIIASNDSDEAKEYFISKGVSLYLYNINKNSLLSLIKFNLIFLKRAFFCEKIICHFLITYLSLFPTIALFSRKTILSIEGLGSLFSERKYLQNILKKIFNILNVRIFFCNNNEKMLIGNKNSIVFGPIGVDINFFTPSSNKNTYKSNFKLVYIGRLLADKGFWDLIKLLELIKSSKNNISIELEIVGDIYPNNPSSITNEQIERIKKRFGNSIKFTSFTHDIKDIYSRTDILLLPSRREGFPVCVMEASAMGIPSIVYDVPGSQDAVKNNINGLIARPLDINDFFNKITKLLDKEVLQEYQITSRYYAIQNFNVESISNRFIQLIL